MIKTLKWLSASLILSGTIVFLFLKFSFNNDSSPCCCPFCDEKILDYQKFYEDDLVLALYTHKPILPGHSLIIPKRHVERFELLTEQEMIQIGRVIKKVNRAVEEVFGTSFYLLLQKNGKEVGQTVPHIHFHYIPRKAGDDSSLALLLKIFISNLSKPIAATEMKENVKKLKDAIDKAQD